MVGAVVWITGLSASGKTTFMHALSKDLSSHGLRPIRLDGDELRRIFRSEGRSYDYDGRLALGKQYSDLCQMLSRQGHVVLIATIALFHEIHAKNRREIANYVEVFMDTPMEVVQRRDPKGLYADESTGLKAEVVGVAWDAELPMRPDFRVLPSSDDFQLALRDVGARVLSIFTRTPGSDLKC